ncbi:related to cytochrome P450 67 [Phialocephala subalpina]|uniref:Related to cytochrome P450 67 n=1 Tax=Phialocephala subalpina TaxID=576137 RepID=A0A1L7XGM6_9HELO|nr:related to cytochrome P450 67 [Phialocephala subalpina]
MSMFNLFLFPSLPLILTILAVVYYILPYFTTFRSLASIHGPWSAKFSNIWLGLSTRNGRKFAAAIGRIGNMGRFSVLGTIIREGIADSVRAWKFLPERVHRPNCSASSRRLTNCSTFYEAFVVGTTGMFNTRDRIDHTRKRKLMAHAFSLKSVGKFEPYMKSSLERWVAQLDRKTAYPTQNGLHKFDAMPWFSFLAFDIIGDLAFGSLFGMVKKGRDEVEAQLTHGGPVTVTPAVEVLNRRGEVSSALGLRPALRPIAKYLPDPFFTKGVEAVADLNGIAVRSVVSRLGEYEGEKEKKSWDSGRKDILERLIHGKDAHGNKMDRREITAEALTQLITGSDTISKTSCAVFYWILHGERAWPGTVLPKLRAELDAAILPGEDVASYVSIRKLPFLKCCIDEGMRLHSTSAISLPRRVTSEGVEFDGVRFPTGTVLSVRSYTIHYLEEIWGPDVNEFKPDRWLSLNTRQKRALNPFSYGPRACVGQNVAIMELQIIIGTEFRRYDFELHQQVLESHEGFSK